MKWIFRHNYVQMFGFKLNKLPDLISLNQNYDIPYATETYHYTVFNY